ncbi:hypothetical protein ACWPKO_22580 (plasmid) [Coraliomargarita sp. W4R53]
MSEAPKVGGDRHSIVARKNAAEKADEAVRLRLTRMPYRQIAKRVGYAGPGSAQKAVERALKNLPRESATTLRISELETLDLAQRALMAPVLNANLAAVDRLLKIMEHRARLTGLYDNVTDSGIEEFKTVLRAWSVQIASSPDLDDDFEDQPLPDSRLQITEGKEVHRD